MTVVARSAEELSKSPMDESRMADEFGVCLERLMNGDPPFRAGEDVSPLIAQLIELALMLRELKQLRG
jgi:hypothetical protein